MSMKFTTHFNPRLGYMMFVENEAGNRIYHGEYQSSQYVCLEKWEEWRDERLSNE